VGGGIVDGGRTTDARSNDRGLLTLGGVEDGRKVGVSNVADLSVAQVAA
jgi:hypothetical protein